MAKENYRENKDKLDALIIKLQDSETDLDEALVLHAEAKKLITKLEQYLKVVDDKINKVT